MTTLRVEPLFIPAMDLGVENFSLKFRRMVLENSRRKAWIFECLGKPAIRENQ